MKGGNNQSVANVTPSVDQDDKTRSEIEQLKNEIDQLKIIIKEETSNLALNQISKRELLDANKDADTKEIDDNIKVFSDNIDYYNGKIKQIQQEIKDKKGSIGVFSGLSKKAKEHSGKLKITGAVAGTGAVVYAAKKFYDYRQKSNKEAALEQIVNDPSSFPNIDKSYRSDKKFLLRAISQNSEVIIYISRSIKTQQFYLEAIKANNEVILHISEELKENNHFLLKAIKDQNDILLLMKKDITFNKILEDASFIDELEKSNITSKKAKSIISELGKKKGFFR